MIITSFCHSTLLQMSNLSASVLRRLYARWRPGRDWRCTTRIVSIISVMMIVITSTVGFLSELLGFGAKDTAYYIRCHDCRQYFIEHPEVWEGWEEEMRETQAKLASLKTTLPIVHPTVSSSISALSSKSLPRSSTISPSNISPETISQRVLK